MRKSCCLGIDTSNYKTSVALVSKDGEIICNLQQYLNVKKGERGLRQSDALFQHIMNLPDLIEKAFSIKPSDYNVDCVSVSDRPRPVEGSYMPVFNGGLSVGRSIASATGIPFYSFSHQEGHIEAVKHYSAMKDKKTFVSFHFSGGTTEALLVKDGNITVVGGSKDLALGQVIDRIGVAYNMNFPCGAELDRMEEKNIPKKDNLLPKIKCNDGFINLSGIETKAQRLIESGQVEKSDLVSMLFYRLSQAICDICTYISEKYHTTDFLFAGGVSSSERIRKYLTEELKDFNLCFGDAALSTDNAVGTALLGGEKIWR